MTNFFMQLLEWITIEKILQIILIHSQNSIPHGNIHTIKNSKPILIKEIDILQNCLPEEIFSTIFQNNLIGMYTVSFILRHRLSFLSLCLHHISSAGQPDASVVFSLFNEDIKNTVEEIIHHPLLYQSNTEKFFPVIGFSPIGIYLYFNNSSTCRAFDAYDIPVCSNLSINGLFCEKHETETWWKNQTGISIPPSTQAKMFSFYARKENFDHFNEKQLKLLVNDFWEFFQKKSLTIGSSSLEESLTIFSLQTKEELQKIGITGLRKKFTHLAFSIHPDQGGSNQEFNTLFNAYNELKVILEHPR